MSSRKRNIMISVIVMSILVIIQITSVCIYLISANKDNYDLADTFEAPMAISSVLGPLSVLVCIVSLCCGYCETSHTYSKERIVNSYTHEVTTTREFVNDAEKYNHEEQEYNNYWCRFTLRTPDLIDIDYYIFEVTNK